MKKIIICISFCIISFVATGCDENIISTLSTDSSSTVPSTQSTNDSSMDSSTPEQSIIDTVTSMPTKSTEGTSTTPPVPAQSEKPNNTGDDKMSNNCKLIVKGKDITSGNYIKLNFEYRYAELPLTAVIKELGAKVEWQDKTKAKITFGGKDYILDTTKGSLIESGSTFNVLSVAPGSHHGTYYQIISDEFVIDSDSALLLVNNMMGAKIRIDFDNQIVNIG